MKFFRTLIVAVFVLHIFWFFSPFLVLSSEDLDAAFTWVGVDALIDNRWVLYISFVFTALYFIAYIGLFFYQKWSRLLLLVLAASGIIVILVSGMSVQTAVGAALGYSLTLLEGSILALSYSSAGDKEFRGVVGK